MDYERRIEKCPIGKCAIAILLAGFELGPPQQFRQARYALTPVNPNIRKSEVGLHADELETPLSLVIQPENVHMEKAIKEFPSFFLSSRWVVPDLQALPTEYSVTPVRNA